SGATAAERPWMLRKRSPIEIRHADEFVFESRLVAALKNALPHFAMTWVGRSADFALFPHRRAYCSALRTPLLEKQDNSRRVMKWDERLRRVYNGSEVRLREYFFDESFSELSFHEIVARDQTDKTIWDGQLQTALCEG